MRFHNKKAFTLVELLVVITILAIISVVAYQNFWWAVDKAMSWRKVSDVATIETALQQYKSDNNYYPSIDSFSWTNLWWYNSWVTATPSNKIKVIYNWEEINSLLIASSVWWWVVYWSWTWATYQIWAKWTISKQTLWKYLTKDLYDPELWDITVWTSSDKMINYWIGRYVYSTYKRPTSTTRWSVIKTWSNYNIAYTVKKNWTDEYTTKIVWDYDENSCNSDSDKCPSTLIWTSSSYLIDWQLMWTTRTWTTLSSYDSSTDLQWIPYFVTDFAQ